MTIDQAIAKLYAARKKIGGDALFMMLTDTPDGLFYMEWEPKIDIVEIPKNDYQNEFEPPACAVAWPSCLNDVDEMESN
jgi:hypothetical protein